MNDRQKREAAKKFAEKWSAKKGYEKGEAQTFWNELLHNVYGVENTGDVIQYEVQVKDETTNFIDGYISSTRVVIEQKGSNVDLTKKAVPGDKNSLTPYQQAQKYAALLGSERYPKWIIVCNFREFHLHDMKQPSAKPKYIIQLSELENDYNLMNFLVKFENVEQQRQKEVSVAAGKLIDQLYDALAEQYDDPESPETMRNLNILCVRLVFCLYAEDAGIFENTDTFRSYLGKCPLRDMHKALKELFRVLDMTQTQRDAYDKYMSRANPELAAFPYVNGGLFSEEDIDIPPFTEKIRDLLLKEASAKLRWNNINPTIFGALFESTLDPGTRQSGGMHYTSIENIHKIIDPLFLDDLKAELADIIDEDNDNPKEKTDAKLTATSKKKTKKDRKKAASDEEEERIQKLVDFQNKLANLTFLDPACGSGNFLTETYLSLRSLENQVIAELKHGQIEIGDAKIFNPIKVQISQFYGIEINDFAVAVAKTALWIAESQMMQKTKEIIKFPSDFLPLKTNANIHEGNALKMDWGEVIPREKINYIISNPPFMGYSNQTKEQKNDILSVYVDEKGKPYKTAGKIDYVAGWYFKAAEFMQGTSARAAFVSTNSITQGEQVAGVWKPLFDRFKIHIDFAHRTFRWDNEATDKAHVHCVIVGYSVAPNDKQKIIYDDGVVINAEKINAYLLDADDIFIESRAKPLCDVPAMVYGNKPTDGGFLFLTPDEKDEAVKKEPSIQKYIKRIYGAEEYIKDKKRYCLWLVDASPSDLRKSAFIKKRIEGVQNFRMNSAKEATRKSANTPTLFQEIRQPETEYIIIPCHSSGNRRYVPFGFISPEVIVNNAVLIIPNATLYHFGVITSNVHMAWMRAICGRLGVGYRYSKEIVYNNFPWPEPTPAQREKIEKTAQAILDARAKFPEASPADLYDELVMPPALRSAHVANNRAVMEAYGFVSAGMNEAACVAELMKLYADKTKSEEPESKK